MTPNTVTSGFATSAEKGNRMENNAKKNADIAMERFKVQSYNWNKRNKTLMKIYGVSETFVTKMRREVGIVSAKDKCGEARKLFKCHPEHHNLPDIEVAKIYGVSESTARTFQRELRGTTKAVARRIKNEKLDNLIYNHRDFGTPGEHAAVPTKVLARRLGVKRYTITVRRGKAGVLSYRAPITHPLTRPEIRAYKLCRLTRSWGRAKNIDRYLESRDG